MKRLIVSATNSMNLPVKIDVTASDDDLTEVTLDDRIKQVNDDFSYILDGLEQLNQNDADELLTNIEVSVQSFIQQIAEKLS